MIENLVMFRNLRVCPFENIFRLEVFYNPNLVYTLETEALGTLDKVKFSIKFWYASIVYKDLIYFINFNQWLEL
jgi:hypothetical protein